MTNFLRTLYTAGAVAIALGSMPAMGQTQFAEVTPPQVPAAMQVPAGNTAFLKGQATGTQNYICMPTATGFGWKFTGPQATLFISFNWINGEVKQQITTHYLSPNPMEAGTPRATWLSSLDTSAVWAKAIVTSTDTNYVAPGAIPWLLLQIVGSQTGPTGGDMLKPTSYIQRVNTAGGVMPAAGCTEESNVGATAFVPYTTDYYFFKSSRRF